jgi:hypothetical protein
MNRSAVALAADSAVTIGRPGQSKTFETVNKLFELVKGSNVGVMIYSAAAINGTPWEAVIKTYRKENALFTASHVEDYANNFVKFVSEHEGLMTVKDEDLAVIQIAASSLRRHIMNPLLNYPGNLLTSTGRVVKAKVKRAIDSIADRWEQALDRMPDLELEDSTIEAINSRFPKLVCRLIDALFDEYVLDPTPAQTKRLAQLSVLALKKEIVKGEGTGLVFAGFGENDYFPTMCSGRIRARLCGEALTGATKVVSITPQEPAFVETFAQDGPAKGWINGIHDEVRGAVMKEWSRWADRNLRRQAITGLEAKGFTNDRAKEAASVFQDLARKQMDTFSKVMDALENDEFRKPMQSSIAVLPKDELGLLAESLVNLTSLRQRMSINQQNTVGGAIDVAVISIGDGFVWLNRKHYFDSALNPAWHLTHGASIRTAITNTVGDQNAGN